MGDPALIPELYVRDIVKSTKFYTDILGFTVLYAREEEAFAMLDREGAQIMIEQYNVGRKWLTGELEYPFGRGMSFQIEVSDVDGLYQSVCENDIPLFLDIEEKWYRTNEGFSGNKQFIVQDFDGYLLRFFQDLGIKNA